MPDDDRVARLGIRLADEAAKRGYTMRGFSYCPVIPGVQGGPVVQAAFTINSDPSAGDDQAAFDAAFAEIAAQQQADQHAEKVRLAREALQRRLQQGGGILD